MTRPFGAKAPLDSRRRGFLGVTDLTSIAEQRARRVRFVFLIEGPVATWVLLSQSERYALTYPDLAAPCLCTRLEAFGLLYRSDHCWTESKDGRAVRVAGERMTLNAGAK